MAGGGIIRASFMEGYPMMDTECPQVPSLHITKGCPRPGIAVEIFMLIINHLNLTMKIVQVRDKRLDVNYNFTSLLKNKTDIYVNTFVNTSVLGRDFDFTDPLYTADTIIATRRMDNSLNRGMAFLNVYSWDTWLCIVCVFALFSGFGIIVRHCEQRLGLRRKAESSKILWKMVRFQLMQSESIDYKLMAGRVSLFVFSAFQLCIVLGLFQSFILSSVVRKRSSKPFTANDNFPQLIKTRRFTIVTSTPEVWFFQQIRRSFDTNFIELRDALKSNPFQVVGSDEQMIRTVSEKEGYVALLEEDDSSSFLAESYCNLLFIRGHIPIGHARFMFLKGSPFVKMFNEAILANRVRIQNIKSKYLGARPPSKCAAVKKGPAPLTIIPCYGLLFLFGVGVALACLVFGGELWKGRSSHPIDSEIQESKTEELSSPTIILLHGNSIKRRYLPPGTQIYALVPAQRKTIVPRRCTSIVDYEMSK